MNQFYNLRSHISICLILITVSLHAQTTITDTIRHNGVIRSYILRLPANNSASNPAPLVFNLHGFGSNAPQQQLYSFMNTVADRENFAVCYPEGISAAWNVGWEFGSTADDVGFISAMIDKFKAKYGIISEQIYSCGMSNGGFMSYRLACELNDKIAAIASVTGSIVPAYVNDCKPGRPVPVLEIHGTEDRTVEYTGSLIALPISDVLAFWQKNNGCDLTPTKTDQPNNAPADNMKTEIFKYNNCNDGTEVWHYKVIGGGHTWPGSFISTGPTTQDFNASEVVWEFFKQFKLTRASSTQDGTNKSGLKIYPNPVSDQLVIESNDNATIVIHTAQGKCIHTQKIISGSNIIDMQGWNPGLYFIQHSQSVAMTSYKVVKI